jgi:hypothetical protein
MVRVTLFLILSFCGSVLQVHSQSCIPAETVFKLNFGSPSKPEGDYIMKAGGYNKVNDKCPQDGNYAIVPQTYSCFDDSWHKIYVDHSGKGGNFLLVNAADNPKRLIIFPVNNLTSDKDYEFSFWVNNVLSSPKGCSPEQPVIEIKIESADGKVLTTFNSGSIPQTSSPVWVPFKVYFTLPASSTGIFIRIENRVPGGCGNDFALDDFVLKICKEVAEEKVVPKKVETVNPNLVKKEEELKKAVQEEEAKLAAIKEQQQELKKQQDENARIIAEQKADLEKLIQDLKAVKELLEANKKKETEEAALKSEEAKKKEITNLVYKRENPILETVKIKEGPFTISVYDDKLVDGDSISLIVNGEIALMKVPLSKEAQVINYTIDKNNPRIELIFIAENLGTIPPNTGTLEIKSGNKIQQVFVKTNEDKNAKIIIELY